LALKIGCDTGEEEKRGRERKRVRRSWGIPFIRTHGGGGWDGGGAPRGSERHGGGGGWRGARAALSAGSGPPVAGAGGRHVRVGLVLNRGEAGG
jgi:hypothetical protein